MKNLSSGTAFYSEPHIQFLTQILVDIKRGSLLVPRFQRPFVWVKSQQLDLLRSIRQGIPIGAIMVWRTASSHVSCYESLGPFPLEVNLRNGTKDYLLDGVQRLSTLFGSLNTPTGNFPEESEEDDIPYHTFFDLKTQDFLFLSHEDVPHPYQLPLHILLDSVALIRYQRGLSDYPDRDFLIEESDRLAGAFRQYKVPIIPIATDDLALATLTFQRINSQGQKMSDYHMLHALTWSSSFDLMKQMENLRNDILSPFGWEDIDEDPILKAVKLALGLDVYKADVENLSHLIAANSSILDETVEYISRAASFFKEELSIPSPDFVPYSLQIVLLADAFRRFRHFDQEQTNLIRNWFWFVTYTEAFSGISDDKVRVAVDDLILTLQTRRAIWRNKARYTSLEARQRFDFRSVRTKSFLLNLARLMDQNTDNKLGTRLLSEYGRRAIHQIVPTTVFSSDFRSLASSPGNKVLADPEYLGSLRRSLVQKTLNVNGEASLLRHGIIGGNYADASERPENFVQHRAEELFHLEKMFADETAGAFWKEVSGLNALD